MDSVKVESPFRSPNVTNLPPRSRAGSGSSSSSEKQSPARQTPTNVYSNSHHSSHSGSGGDENDPHSRSSSGNNGGDYSRINPFEKDVLAGLHGSFWSPSIMEIHETPPQRSWAIEHLAHLFPKDIENSPSTHQNSLPVDPQTEAKAQADIDSYFSRGPIVPTPSPMKEKQNHVNYSELSRFGKNTVPFIHMGQSPIARGGGVGMNNGMIKKKKLVPVIEKWTQTVISFPAELPEHVEEVLSQYFQSGELCGSSNEANACCSQRSEASENADCGDNDSGKNSSLNTSIRRRLDLSFGEDDSNDPTATTSPIPIVDPFRKNHMVSTPPNFSTTTTTSTTGFNTTTTELEIQLMRCEFTPEARGMMVAITPGITPIQDEADDTRSNACSTPRRINSNSRRWTFREDSVFPVSPMEDCQRSSISPNAGGSKETMQVNLRRCRVETPKANRKTGSGLSLDDSQIMDVFSPPAKLPRRSLENENR
ncbi:Protein aurora borealis [Orchesella cincta]|uniref:Protein aurora borealis n=1 Tax=Orchesella cincta TaxID=48709 RepID=A0A1D2MTQ5_ORCCI|nr:Protein aurora borealis [Orchesella cincta]